MVTAEIASEQFVEHLYYNTWLELIEAEFNASLDTI